MEKLKFYINMGSQEISQIHEGNNDVFTIYATSEEIIRLRQVFDEVYEADNRTFIRSHIPFVPYHKDQSNDDYDGATYRSFQMLHDLGDEKTKAHIESMGVIDKELE